MLSLLPVAVGGAAVWLGGQSVRLSRRLYGGVVCLALAVLVAAGLCFVKQFQDFTGPILDWIGGPVVLGTWAGLLLVGIVWKTPGRSMSRGFLGILVLLALGGITFENSGRLIWRWFGGSMWEHRPDARGRLAQSRGMTCSPTAGVMLLQRYEVPASEGELAYLANTSLLGTSPYGLARALQAKVDSQGWEVHAETVTFADCLARTPFVASVRIPGIGGHALLVERIQPGKVHYIDPLDGMPYAVSHETFEVWWDGRIVYLVIEGG